MMQPVSFSARLKKAGTPYVLLAPAVLLLLLISLYPFFTAIRDAFTDVDYVGGESHFVGLGTFRDLIANTGTGQFFWHSAMNSVIWTGAVVLGQLVLGLLAALVLNEKFPGRAFFRTAVLVPIAIPTVMSLMTWRWMYDPSYGLINHYLRMIGVVHGQKAWILQTNSTIWPLVVVGIWLGFPFMCLMLLSGLQSIPQETYEAAMLDGAGTLQKLRYITLPQLRPIIVIAVTLETLWWWNHFDTLMILGTAGQTGFNQNIATLPILAWIEAFRWGHLALGAAISVVSMVLLGGLMSWNVRRQLRSINR